MNLKELSDSIDIQTLQRYVSEGQEENLHLEFKTVNLPFVDTQSKNSFNTNYSKSLSAFGNSDGGLIIWGVLATRGADGIDVAKELRPIKNIKALLSRLNELESEAISPPILGVEHRAIESGSVEGFVITYVPKSSSPPHMARLADRKYFQRIGSSSQPCEHYAVADMFQRVKTPKLKLELRDPRFLPTGDYDNDDYRIMRFQGLLSILNESDCIAKYPYLRVWPNYPYSFGTFGLGSNQTGLPLAPIIDHTGKSRAYAGGVDICVHSRTYLDVDTIILDRVTSPLSSLCVQYNLHAENMSTVSNVVEISQSFLSELWQQEREKNKRRR